jgi:hypothetical protein
MKKTAERTRKPRRGVTFNESIPQHMTTSRTTNTGLTARSTAGNQTGQGTRTECFFYQVIITITYEEYL